MTEMNQTTNVTAPEALTPTPTIACASEPMEAAPINRGKSLVEIALIMRIEELEAEVARLSRPKKRRAPKPKIHLEEPEMCELSVLPSSLPPKETFPGQREWNAKNSAYYKEMEQLRAAQKVQQEEGVEMFRALKAGEIAEDHPLIVELREMMKSYTPFPGELFHRNPDKQTPA